MTDPTRLTAIPLETLFAIIGALIVALATVIGWIGSNIRDEIHALRNESVRRGNQVAAVHTILGVICGKLGIDYHPPDP